MEALEQCGLMGFERRDTTALSGGEQQRLALAGVLAMHPRYLVLDEATSMLDSAIRSSFRTLVFQLAREQGIGVVQITHEPQEVLSSDRVVLMHDGELRWEGTPLDLLRHDGDLPGDPLRDSGFVRALRAAMRLGFKPGASVAPNSIKEWLILALESRAIRKTDVLSVIEACRARAHSYERGPVLEQPGIVAEHIVHSYEPGNPVLNDVSLEAPAGTVTLLLRMMRLPLRHVARISMRPMWTKRCVMRHALLVFPMSSSIYTLMRFRAGSAVVLPSHPFYLLARKPIFLMSRRPVLMFKAGTTCIVWCESLPMRGRRLLW